VSDRQPLLSALGACGSESCVLLLTELMQKGDLEPEQAQSYLAAIALTPHPSPLIVDSINVGHDDRLTDTPMVFPPLHEAIPHFESRWT